MKPRQITNLNPCYYRRRLKVFSQQFIMVAVVLVLLMVSYLALFGNASQLNSQFNSNLSLVAIFSVIRHGDRSPTEFYPNDPFQNESYWPEGIGELNQVGIERMKQTGALYLQRYGEFLRNTDGWPDYVKSSIRKRSIESAEFFLNLFLARDKPTANVTTMIQQDQLMLTTTYPCNKSNNAWLSWFSSEQVTGYIDNQKENIEHLEKLTGDNYLSATPYTLRNLEFLATTLEIERDEYKLDVPSWAKEQNNIDLMTDLKRHAFLFDWKPPVVQRYRVGPLLGDIRDNIARIDSGSTKQRFYLYSTHDVNQVLFLQAFNIYDQINNWPTSYSSAIVIEVYNQTEGVYLLRLLYREVSTTDSSTDPNDRYQLIDHSLNITSCPNVEWVFLQNQIEPLCPFKDFQNLIQDKVPVHYDEECRVSSSTSLMLWTYGQYFWTVEHNLLILFIFFASRHLHKL